MLALALAVSVDVPSFLPPWAQNTGLGLCVWHNLEQAPTSRRDSKQRANWDEFPAVHISWTDAIASA